MSLHAHLKFFYLSQICIYVLCATLLLCNSTVVHNLLLPACITLCRSNLLFFVLCIFIMPSPFPDHTPNSLSPLAITLSLFFIHGRYAETLWLLWKLPSSTLFHLPIIYMMSFHTIVRYLKTLQLFWQSPSTFFEFSGWNHQWFSAVTISSSLAVIERTFEHSSLWRLFLSWENYTVGVYLFWLNPFLSHDHRRWPYA